MRRSKEAVAEVLDSGLDRAISYYGRPYRVPDAYTDRRVWTRLKGDRLTIRVGRATLAEYPLDYEPRT